MPADLLLALQISLVGLTLIFAAIVLLWGLMALLVRLTPDPAPGDLDAVPAKPSDRRAALRLRAQAVLAVDAAPRVALRSRAAAVAVAVLLAGLRPALLSPPPPTATVSPWQAAMRASRLRQRGPTR
jgi:hypothetical protein